MEHDFGLHTNANNRKSLGEKLDVIIRNLPPDQVTLTEIRDLLGRKACYC